MENNRFDIREQKISDTEREFEKALRPLAFDDFNGQEKIIENLRVFVMAARMRQEPLDHVLLALPDWGRPHSPISWLTSWGWVSK